jgi:signal transduction histidine kinase
MVLVSAGGVAIMETLATHAQLQAVRTELSQLAAVGASLVDGDAHRAFTRADQSGSPEHLAAIAPLVKFHKATRDVMYVYTLILKDDQLRLVLGSDWVYRVEGDNLPPDPIMSPLPVQEPDARDAIINDRVVVHAKPQPARFRSYLSAYAPFHDRAGKVVGVLGVDMWTRALDERLAPLRTGSIIAACVLLVVATLVALYYHRYRSDLDRSRSVERAQALALQHERDRASQEAATARLLANEAMAASRAKSAFLATMSHELRTPLHGVIGMAELLQNTPLNATQQRYANVVEQSGRSLLRIVADVLDFSRVEAGKLDMLREPYALRDLIEEIRTLFEAKARAKGLTLAVDIDSALPDTLIGDAERVKQVLVNLLGNAIKFTVHGAVRLTVSSIAARGELCMLVCDSGPGIPPGSEETLFQPFSQLDNSSTRRFEGTGLGLALSRRIAEAMGGTLELARDARVTGACFVFTCPLNAAHGATPAAVATGQSDESPSS